MMKKSLLAAVLCVQFLQHSWASQGSNTSLRFSMREAGITALVSLTTCIAFKGASHLYKHWFAPRYHTQARCERKKELLGSMAVRIESLERKKQHLTMLVNRLSQRVDEFSLGGKSSRTLRKRRQRVATKPVPLAVPRVLTRQGAQGSQESLNDV